MLRAATVMKLRRPECDEQPSKPSCWNSATHQLTTVLAFRCDPRYERITGPRDCRRQLLQRPTQIGMHGNPAAAALLSDEVADMNRVGHPTASVEHHRPAEPGDLAGA